MTEPTTEEQEPRPVNNIFKVPINELSSLKCLGDEVITGALESSILVEADSPEEAKVILQIHYPGFVDNYVKLPENRKKHFKPFRFRKGQIEQVLHCERRFKNKDGDYTCGVPVDERGMPSREGVNGEFGMCCIEKYNIPEFSQNPCPYKR